MNSRFDRLRARFETLISGRAPDDPLYLTNRTWRQKLATGALVALPVVLVLGMVLLISTDSFRKHRIEDPYEKPLESQTAATPAGHMPDPKLRPADMEIVNIHIVHDAHPSVVGVIRNNTDHKVDSAQVSYYMADKAGSLLGTDSTDVENVAAHGTAHFHLPLKQPTATFVFVREIRVN